MSISRRNLMGAAVALCTAAPIQGLAASQAIAAPATGLDGVKALAAQHFASRGYAAGTPRPLVSAVEFNGGLNYSVIDLEEDPTKSLYVIQRCARIEDAQAQRKPGTLPVFTMLSLYPADTDTVQRRNSDLLEFLTATASLDPKRLRVTTTELAKPLFAEFERHGISAAQIRLRPLAEAKAEGGGSGWFAPKGHPNAPAFATYSVEFVKPDGSEIEIAEAAVEFAPPHNGGSAIGLERLAMARNDRFMGWNDVIPTFKQAVEADSLQSGNPLPAGYFIMLGLPQPG